MGNRDDYIIETSDTLEHPDRLAVFRIAWRRKWLIALGIVRALVAGALHYARCQTIYRSDAQVLVVEKRPDAVTGEVGRVHQFEDYVSTQRILIVSPLIVERAIKQDKLDELRSFSGQQGDMTEAMIKNLSVGRASRDAAGNANSVLTLSYHGPVATDCDKVVRAVVDSYRAFLDETYRNMSDDTLKLIREARDVLENSLAKKETAYREFREKSPMIWKGKEEVNPYQERLTRIDAQRLAFLLRQADMEGQLATIAAARKAGRSEDELTAPVSELSSKSEAYGRAQSANPDHNPSLTLKSRLEPLLLEERELTENFGPNHPQVRSVRKRIEATRMLFALPSVSAVYTKGGEPGKGPRQMSPNLVETYAQYLQQQLEGIKTSERALIQLYNREQETAQKLNTYEIRDEDFKKDIARTEVLYDGLVKRLQEASLAKDYGGFEARVIAPPGIGKKVFPNPLIIFPGSLFVGLLGGVGLAYLAELMDRSFRTPEEIRRRLGMPVMGQIPRVTLDKAARQHAAANGGLDPMLVVHYQRHSAGAEAFRTVRTAIYFSTAGQGHKIIQITSPNQGDGKSTLTANVAASIAQLGKRTLLIDADLRSPRQHKIFALSAAVGLASVIGQDAEHDDAIQASAVDNLWVLPCGPVPPDPAELLTSPRFPELLQSLRERYDYVLIDSAPLLPVTDGSVVARVDGVLLTLRPSKHGRPTAECARDILNTVVAHPLGFVVNGVQHDFGYGYGYGYGPVYGDARKDQAEEGNGQPPEEQVFDRLRPDPSAVLTPLGRNRSLS